MQRRALYRLFILCSLLFGFHQAGAEQIDLNQRELALPEGTIIGKLDNGMEYIILENSRPESRVEFRLVLKTGSVQESDEQKGSAHFLEHIAFGGTKNFPQRSLVDYIESLGMKYGRDLNAFTGHDRTIYLFAVPVDINKEEVVDNSLLIIRDWMEGLDIEPQKVENEKGIILEELRSFDAGDDFYDLKIGEGRYANRMPLGDIENIEQMSVEILEEYYKWYDPSIATLVVVGDIKAEEIEGKIKEALSPLKQEEGLKLGLYPLLYEEGTHLHEVRDSLNKKTTVELIIPHTTTIQRTIADAVTQRQGSMLLSAVNKRLKGRSIDASLSNHWYLSDKDHLVITIEADNREELLNSVANTASELQYIVEEGWLEEEFEEIKESYMKHLSSPEEYTRHSYAWGDIYTDYVLSGDRHLLDKEDAELVKQELDKTQSSDLQEMLREWLSHKEDAMLVACKSHDGIGEKLEAEEIDMAWLDGVERTPEEYVFVPKEKDDEEDIAIETPECLKITSTFDKSKIVSQTEYESLKIREVVLDNGIRLILKPTTDDGNILVSLFAPYGLSVLSESQYPLLGGAAGYIDMGGLAKVDSDIFSDYIYENDISLAVTLEDNWHGFIGSAPEKQMVEFFNVVREKIYAPELDYDSFDEVKESMLKSHGEVSTLEKMLNRDPDRLLANRLSELTGFAPRHASGDSTKEQIEQMDLDDIGQFYTELYGDLSETTVVLCGNFDCDQMIEKFGSVFGDIDFESYDSRQMFSHELPNEKIVERFETSHETQTVFDYIYLGNYEPKLKNTLTLKLMRDVIHNRVLEVLRERESLVYSPYVMLFYNGLPKGVYYFDINASGENSSMDVIDSEIKTILTELRNNVVSDEELNNLKRSFQIAKREALNSEATATWRTTIVDLLKNGETLEEFDNYDEILNSITPESLNKAFNEYIDMENYLLLYLSQKTHKL